jgi:beta-lactamase class A
MSVSTDNLGVWRESAVQELVNLLNQKCDERPFETCWYLKDLNTGQEAHRDGYKMVTSASTRKISIMMAIMNQVNKGNLSLDDEFIVDQVYKDRAATQRGGCFQYFRSQPPIVLFDALVMMIIVSDNTSTGKIVDLIGPDTINEFCHSIGMDKTHHKHGSDLELDIDINHPVEASNTTSAQNVGMLLEMILNGSNDPSEAAKLGCTPELCATAIQILKWQMLRTKLPPLLPGEAVVAHKTGTGLRHANDAGIIYKREEPQFILSVYTDGVPKTQPDGPNGQTAAARHIAKLCRTCWDHLVA